MWLGRPPNLQLMMSRMSSTLANDRWRLRRLGLVSFAEEAFFIRMSRARMLGVGQEAFEIHLFIPRDLISQC